MKKYDCGGTGWNAWFWLDGQDSDCAGKPGERVCRVENAVGRDDKGRLFLMVWTNLGGPDWRGFTQEFYELDKTEYTALLDRAIRHGKVSPGERDRLIARADSPFYPPWDTGRDVVVYSDDRYTLGQEGGSPYLTVGGKKYYLSCQPYEPCLYICRDDSMTVVHNAFEPFAVLESFSRGDKVLSITGYEYDARDFCRMAEYAADMGEVSISDAEEIFGGRARRRSPDVYIAREPEKVINRAADGASEPELDCLILGDAFYDVIAQYPDAVVDYCLVKNVFDGSGANAHRRALAQASRYFFLDGEGAPIWRYDCGKAECKPLSAAGFFCSAGDKKALSYRRAFLDPPHGRVYGSGDFEKVNAALFPNGTGDLEIYEWTTDWSEYFDDGREWWGTLCCTVYDKTLDRFAVIMASATD